MISKPEAAEALREMERVHRTTTASGAYSKASPHLLFSGVVWITGYIATGFIQPEHWASLWVPLAFIAATGSYVIAYRAHRETTGNPAGRTIHASRLLWTIAMAMTFMVTTFLLFQPRELAPYLAFPALLMAFVYVLLGAFGLRRFQWIGAAMFALVIVGLILGREALPFWIAAAGGGGLILGGLWLRRA